MSEQDHYKLEPMEDPDADGDVGKADESDDSEPTRETARGRGDPQAEGDDQPALKPSDVATPAQEHGEVDEGGVGEPAEQVESGRIRSLDTCPNCGANLATGVVVCLRCGFNLKDLKVVETKTGAVETDAEVDEAERPPVVPPGRGELMVPAIIAGVCVLIMMIAYLAGAPGLFASDLTEIGFWARLLGLGRYIIVGGILATALWFSVVLISRIEMRPLGDAGLAMVRSAAVAAGCMLALLIPEPFGWALLESILQLVFMGVIFIPLTLMFFDLIPRMAGYLGVMALLILGILFGIAELLAALV